MLQQVVLNSSAPVILNIDSVDPDEIIVVKSISGLTPADVTLFTGDFARDGGYYQGRRSGSRNPVLTLKLNPDYANDIEVSDIREQLYSIFYEPYPNSDELQVILKDDRKPDRYFKGVTEKFPAEIFARETTAQISMLCVDPFLRSVDEVNENEAVGWSSVPVDYDGSARTGLEMTFEVKTAVDTMTVDINGNFMTLTKPSGNFAVDDVIVINTEIGSRAITWEGVDSMTMLTPTSDWLSLSKGINTINTYGNALADGKVVMTNYRYRSAWWGV